MFTFFLLSYALLRFWGFFFFNRYLFGNLRFKSDFVFLFRDLSLTLLESIYLVFLFGLIKFYDTSFWINVFFRYTIPQHVLVNSDQLLTDLCYSIVVIDTVLVNLILKISPLGCLFFDHLHHLDCLFVILIKVIRINCNFALVLLILRLYDLLRLLSFVLNSPKLFLIPFIW